ncbi:Peptidoglycan glycosyltransferase [Catenulispora acidiphila DSM 44928]|uniref:Peptidoglycan glycosyltransferase n=1 Tax=Catenulispora acidiphila (strain DSM 44928 / JCM 14897 / NBRC 102108 / NRRL B-24433 / ID139908) TaxID=479433 RepID=C7QFQ3_CATAD|nr:penicillin-binding transpeptidase domain-containing protein [Catenulispora acidiphila]ACU68992.1 Peptidoglycan glycosyltransferase [Catenulispora acidiphila DSM 44928]
MNQPIRRVAIFCFLLIASLLVSSNYLQVVNADSYKARAGNQRTELDYYAYPRGKILTADGTVIADSVPSGGLQYKYQRTYPLKADYANITGWKSIVYGSRDIENVLDKYLQGTDSSESVANFMDTLTGKSKKGGDVQLTLQNAVQQAAIKGLGKQNGSVVALDPTTGAILAMYSSPSFDPNGIASNVSETSTAAGNALEADKGKPNLNHAIGENYPPGSVFKIVTAAAALDSGKFTETGSTGADPNFYSNGSGYKLKNEDGTCSGTDLKTALAESCNSVYGFVGATLGSQIMSTYASKFGFNDPSLKIPLQVAQSNFPSPATVGTNVLGLAQDSIGQGDTQVTPLQAAMIAAAVANGGTIMQPYMVDKETAPNGHVTYKGSDHQHELSQAMSPATAATLDDMMQNVVTHGTAQGRGIPGVQMGAKTGTAQRASGQNPLAWFVCYGTANGKKVAVAVMVDTNDPSIRSDVSGVNFAGPTAQAVLKAALGVG